MTQHIKTKSDMVPVHTLNRTKSLKGNIKDNMSKPIEDRYSDVFKVISQNYFDKTQIGDTICKNNKKKQQLRSRKSSLQQQGNTWTLKREKQQQYRTQQQFNQNKQVNRLFKLGDIFINNTENNQIDKDKSKEKLTNSLSNLKKNDKYNYSNLKKQSSCLTDQSYSKLKNGIATKYWSRATTGKRGRYNSAKNKIQQQCGFKFIKIDRKQTTEQMKQLKQSVYQLQALAANKYGIEFKKTRNNENIDNLQTNLDQDYEQIELKLKQIRNQRQSQSSDFKQHQDCSIPFNFMKSLMHNYKTPHTFSNHPKKNSFAKYLRV